MREVGSRISQGIWGIVIGLCVAAIGVMLLLVTDDGSTTVPAIIFL